MTKRDLPVTWPALLERNERLLNLSLESLAYLPDDAEEDASLITSDAKAEGKHHTPYASTLLGVSSIIAQAILIKGPVYTLEHVKPLVPVYQKALEELKGMVTNDTRAQVVSIVAMKNALECCGLTGADLVTESESEVAQQISRWVARISRFSKNLSDWEARTVALAAIETGDTEHVPTLVGGGRLPKSFMPGETFQFNTQGLIRYLAVASNTNQTLESVMPAVNDFVDSFPYKLAAGALDWDELLYAGRIAISVIGREPLPVVAEAMNAIIVSRSLSNDDL